MSTLDGSGALLTSATTPQHRVVRMVPRRSAEGLLAHAVRAVRDPRWNLQDTADELVVRSGNDASLLRRTRLQVASVGGRSRSMHERLLAAFDVAVDLADGGPPSNAGMGVGVQGGAQRLRLTQT